MEIIMSILKDEASISEILSSMTLEEKAKMTTGGLPYGTGAMENYGIPAAIFSDSISGINFRQLIANYYAMHKRRTEQEGRPSYPHILECLRAGEKILDQLRRDHRIHPEELKGEEIECYHAILENLGEDYYEKMRVTSFPSGTLLACTWDPDTAGRTANALAREFDTFGIDLIMGPNVNIQRDPLGGRNFESYSEDPFLTGEMGRAFVSGIQQTGILADVKHFAVNNQEKERKGIDVHIPERVLREIYYPAFKKCIQEGHSETVMSAYNRINGVPCSSSKKLLDELLRKEWGFDGMIVSDWGGVYERIESILAGENLEAPMNPDIRTIVKAVEDGLLPEKKLDETVAVTLRTLLKMPCINGHRYKEIDHEYSEETAYQAVCEGTVLLKNENCLPLKKEARVVLCGNGTHRLLECGTGSAEVITEKTTSLYDSMCRIAAPGCVREDVESVLLNLPLESCRVKHKEEALEKALEKAEYVLVTGSAAGQEGRDRDNMLLDGEEQEFVTETLRKAKENSKKTILVLNIAGPVDMRAYLHNADAILCVFIPGCQGGRALADILYGRVNPSGKLAASFPVKYEDVPSFGNFPGYNNEVWYGEGLLVGYRYYSTRNIRPAFAFGHGLSYTRFSIEKVCVSTRKDEIDQGKAAPDEPFCTDQITSDSECVLREGENLQIRCEVHNTGNMDGKEVVQIYIHQDAPTLFRPFMELKAFQKVSVRAGEMAEAVLAINFEQFSMYDEKLKRFVVEPGSYTVLLGNASDTAIPAAKVQVVCRNPYGYSPLTRFADVWADERCRNLYRKHFGKILSENMFNDVLGYSPDFPVGKVLEERLPENGYASPGKKTEAMERFFEEISLFTIL